MTRRAVGTEALVEIERELERCVSDARHHRGGLITLTSFESAEQLARIAESEVIEPVGRFISCCDRARELLEDRRKIRASLNDQGRQ